MRLLIPAILGSLLVSPMSGTDVERALALSRARESERQQFHHRYVFDLPGPVVAQIEVITEFRRMLIIAEEHVLRGDWMFTRGLREAEAALAPTRGAITLRAQIRFNPLNTFIEPPPYRIAIGEAAGGPLEAVATDVVPQYSLPFQTRDKKTLTSLVGATLETSVPAARLGQRTKTIAITLEGQDAGHAIVDFARLD